MNRWMILLVCLALVGFAVAANTLWMLWSPHRSTIQEQTAPDREANDVARQAIQQLKQQAQASERDAAYWRGEAAKHQQTSATLKQKVAVLQAERAKPSQAPRTVEEAFQELQRLGY